MAKHTPGVWVAGLPADGGRINVYSDDAMALRICRVDSDADFGNHASANARLITAAPELLEVAEMAFRHLDQNDPMREHIAKRLRAVILKATGEQP